ncbi:MAG TPA: GNAT family protein [Anaerolineaceae bacterium]|nr:GNAT family protein [Anaerolineaceae bacterium]
MTTDTLTGKLVRLAAPNLDTDVEQSAAWEMDSEFQRLSGSEPARPAPLASLRDWMEAWVNESNVFAIRTLADDRLIGFMDLDGINWASGDSWVGIGLGDRRYWGQGFGTDAMRVIIRYAFEELNLRRISLTVFEYNPRAIRCYENLGFREEGRARERVRRAGRYWDMLYMGLLREEWQPAETK